MPLAYEFSPAFSDFLINTDSGFLDFGSDCIAVVSMLLMGGEL